MDVSNYKSILDMYWREIVEARNYDPKRQQELSQQMGLLVKTRTDEQQAFVMQNELYQRRLAAK